MIIKLADQTEIEVARASENYTKGMSMEGQNPVSLELLVIGYSVNQLKDLLTPEACATITCMQEGDTSYPLTGYTEISSINNAITTSGSIQTIRLVRPREEA